MRDERPDASPRHGMTARSKNLNLHAQSLGHCLHVLVAPSAEAHEDDLVSGKRGGQLGQVEYGVGSLQGWNDAFGATHQLEALQRTRSR